jgi:hypothetical protein
MDTLSKFSLPIVLFLLTLAFGFWLSQVGRPYNGILFNVHKLIALGTVILAVVQIFKTAGGFDLPLTIIALVVAGLCIVALFASGAFLSIGNLDYQVMKTIHNIALAVLVVSLALAVYFLNRT